MWLDLTGDRWGEWGQEGVVCLGVTGHEGVVGVTKLLLRDLKNAC